MVSRIDNRASRSPEPGPTRAAKSGKLPTARPDTRSQTPFAQAAAAYARWLPDGEQLASAAVMCAQAAAMYLDGEAAWLVMIGGSGAGKTERVTPLLGLPHTILTDEITGPAAFLAITPILNETEQEKNAGLLPQIGPQGMLVIKDFTSVLTMPRDRRAQLFSALRHIYDGHYSRDLGAYGGIHLEWEGRLGFIACVTDAIDRAHTVANDLGTRWLQIRLPIGITDDIYANAALDNNASETEMRAELRGIVHEAMENPQKPYDANNSRELITGLGMLLARARSPIFRSATGDIEQIPSPEKPTRVVKQLAQMYRAAGVIGMPEDLAREMITRIAIDTVPMMRGVVLRAVAADPGAYRSVAECGRQVGQPERSVRRAMAELAAHGLLEGKSTGQKNQTVYRLSDTAQGWIRAVGSLPGMAAPPIPPGPEPGRPSRRATKLARPADPWQSPDENLTENQKDRLDRIAEAESADEIIAAQE